MIFTSCHYNGTRSKRTSNFHLLPPQQNKNWTIAPSSPLPIMMEWKLGGCLIFMAHHCKVRELGVCSILTFRHREGGRWGGCLIFMAHHYEGGKSNDHLISRPHTKKEQKIKRLSDSNVPPPSESENRTIALIFCLITKREWELNSCLILSSSHGEGTRIEWLFDSPISPWTWNENRTTTWFSLPSTISTLNQRNGN